MKKLALLLIIAVSIILIFAFKNNDKSKISEKDLLKIHISGNKSR